MKNLIILLLCLCTVDLFAGRFRSYSRSYRSYKPSSFSKSYRTRRVKPKTYKKRSNNNVVKKTYRKTTAIQENNVTVNKGSGFLSNMASMASGVVVGGLIMNALNDDGTPRCPEGFGLNQDEQCVELKESE